MKKILKIFDNVVEIPRIFIKGYVLGLTIGVSVGAISVLLII